jgi:hypothetical protein
LFLIADEPPRLLRCSASDTIVSGWPDSLIAPAALAASSPCVPFFLRSGLLASFLSLALVRHPFVTWIRVPLPLQATPAALMDRHDKAAAGRVKLAEPLS